MIVRELTLQATMPFVYPTNNPHQMRQCAPFARAHSLAFTPYGLPALASPHQIVHVLEQTLEVWLV